MNLKIPLIYKKYNLGIIIDYWHIDVYIWNDIKSIQLIDYINPKYK